MFNQTLTLGNLWVVNCDEVGGDSVTPPKLAGNAPVPDVFQPSVPLRLEIGGNYFHFAAPHRLYRLLRHIGVFPLKIVHGYTIAVSKQIPVKCSLHLVNVF